MTKSQEELILFVKKLGRRGPESIEAGPSEKDAFGRSLVLESQAFLDTELNEKTKKLLREIQSKSELEKTLRNEVMWYDVRSLVWRENPNLSALFALAYASILIERTGRKDGHIINIALDCYPKHFETMSIFADSLIRAGVTENGGGIIYWGVQNGGAIRNISQYQLALTGRGGNWIYGTMSHREEDFAGAKFGMQGRVFCGSDLMKDLYGRVIKGNFPEIIDVQNPEDYVVSVGNLTANNMDVAEDIIRARTGTKSARKELLSGLKLGFDMSGSPVGKNLADILEEFGADVDLIHREIEPFTTDKIIDPNEHESAAMEQLRRRAEKDERIWLAVDPDGDRGTIIALNSEGKAISLTGTELLMLAAENLATYNPEKLGNDVIYDMRTGISIEILAKKLTEAGFPIKLIASEPGYPFFMQLMSENKNAVISVENTNHEFMTPYTNPIWGAPKFYPLAQGGDDAAIFIIYLLGMVKHLWEGRNPVQQLEYIRKKYNVPATVITEFKPALEKKDAAFKYDIAKEMCNIATQYLKNDSFKLDTMNSGVRITDNSREAMVLVRFSNTGPAFTCSGEATTNENSERMHFLGGAIMRLAVEEVKKSGQFEFLWKDYEKYGNISVEQATDILNNNQ